jgi:hypothetical protein
MERSERVAALITLAEYAADTIKGLQAMIKHPAAPPETRINAVADGLKCLEEISSVIDEAREAGRGKPGRIVYNDESCQLCEEEGKDVRAWFYSDDPDPVRVCGPCFSDFPSEIFYQTGDSENARWFTATVDKRWK